MRRERFIAHARHAAEGLQLNGVYALLKHRRHDHMRHLMQCQRGHGLQHLVKAAKHTADNDRGQQQYAAANLHAADRTEFHRQDTPAVSIKSSGSIGEPARRIRT